MLSDNNMLDKDKYYTSVHLNHCMLLFMNRLARMFKFIEVQIEAENKWIKTHLDDIYYNEVYLFSDEYVEQWAERAEAEAEYYAEHPEAFEDMEESEEDRLFEKINVNAPYQVPYKLKAASAALLYCFFGFLTTSGNFSDHGSRSSKNDRSLSSMCLGISVRRCSKYSYGFRLFAFAVSAML